MGEVHGCGVNRWVRFRVEVSSTWMRFRVDVSNRLVRCRVEVSNRWVRCRVVVSNRCRGWAFKQVGEVQGCGVK